MEKFRYSLVASAIISCLLVGCGGSSGGGSTSAEQEQVPSEQPSEQPGEQPSEQPGEQPGEQPSEQPEESSNLSVQVIDGYLPQVAVCIVKDKDPKFNCDTDFIDENTGNYFFYTDINGKIKIKLSAEQKQLLEKRKYVRFKAVVPKGSRDVIYGKEGTTANDMFLLGTKYFESENLTDELKKADENNESFKLTPFTTLADMTLLNSIKNKEEIDKDKYKEIMETIAEKLDLDLATISSDYNNSEQSSEKDDAQKEKELRALVAGEMLANLNYLPKSSGDLTATSENTEKKLVNMKEHLAQTNKFLDDILHKIDDSSEKISGDLIEKGIKNKKKVLATSFVTLGTGLGDEWRCGTTKANEVWCWGNNAWNNLGNQEFTDEKLAKEKYTSDLEENKGVLTYLANNYSAEPLPVLIKNPDKRSADDPEFITLSGVSKVMTGNIFGCAITLNKEVYCWGGNYHAQLGLGTEVYKNNHETIGYAQKVLAGTQSKDGTGYLSNVVDLSLGQSHACALTGDGEIYCWGDNTALELGDKHEAYRMQDLNTVINHNGDDITENIWVVPYPVKVPAPEGVKFTKITHSGYWAHCAISEEPADKEGHNLWCWGNDILGIVSGNNKQYVDSIKQNWEGKIHLDNEGQPDYYSADEPWNWHYRDKGGEWWPMFGQPVTLIKSYKNMNVPEVKLCDNNQQCQLIKVCTWEFAGDKYLGGKYVALGGDEIQAYSSEDYYCEETKVVRDLEMTNIKDIELSTFDNLAYYTTTDDDRFIYGIWVSNLEGTQNSWFSVNPIDINMERVKEIKFGVEHGNLLITEDNHLYGFGENNYGIVGTGSEDDGWQPVTRIFDDDKYQILALSVIKRSVCAIVKDSTADDKDQHDLWCWGSSSFGQLGFDNGDNEFSYGDTIREWVGGANKYFDRLTNIQRTPKKVDFNKAINNEDKAENKHE